MFDISNKCTSFTVMVTSVTEPITYHVILCDPKLSSCVTLRFSVDKDRKKTEHILRMVCHRQPSKNKN